MSPPEPPDNAAETDAQTKVRRWAEYVRLYERHLELWERSLELQQSSQQSLERLQEARETESEFAATAAKRITGRGPMFWYLCGLVVGVALLTIVKAIWETY